MGCIGILFTIFDTAGICLYAKVIDKKISYNPVVVFPIIVESIQDERGENIAFTASKKETGPFTFYHVAVIGDVVMAVVWQARVDYRVYIFCEQYCAIQPYASMPF